MQQEHAENAVDKAVAYVKEMLGIGVGDKPPRDEVPVVGDTQYDLESTEISGMYPREDTLKRATELNAESARREDGE